MGGAPDLHTGRLSYQPLPGRIGAVVFACFAAWWAVAVVLSGPSSRAGVIVPLLVAATAAVWALFWRPAVLVDQDAVLLRNPIRDVRVPWSALEGLDTRFALTLLVGDRRYQSWAAAAPGRPSPRLHAPRGRQPATPLPPDAPRSSRALNTDSGAAAFMVEQRWEQRRDACDPADREVTVQWHVGPVAVVLAGLLIAALVAALT